MLTALIAQGLLLVLVVSGIPLLGCALCGLCVSILQAAMQLQEPTVSFLVRFAAVAVTLWAFGGWMLDQILRYAELSLQGLSQTGQL